MAGAGWVRDRLRSRDLQPAPGQFVPGPTTYDTSASVHSEAGLQVLQVFHDTPSWARDTGQPGGRFAGDLRRVHAFAKDLAQRFRGRVAAWEPWNEANAASFGGHTVDEMCSWQKAAWLGFKSGNPDLIVGWNPTAAVPTPAHTEGVLANETWPHFDTYNLHTYDWAHGYADLWKPAREAASGRPIWITEADRGTPHLKNPPWFDQDPALERLKAEWMGQSYAASLFAGASRHFHFILGHYHEPNGVQFGLLRLDLTPRPAYVALAAIGRFLNDARPLGRWRPTPDAHVYAFRAHPDGIEREVLVAWSEREVDWPERGHTTAPWPLPAGARIVSMVDHLGRPIGPTPPTRLTGAPIFVLLHPGQSASLPLEAPPAPPAFRPGIASPLVLQRSGPRSRVVRVEDLPWSEGHACAVAPGESVDLDLFLYHFGDIPCRGTLGVVGKPTDWEVTLEQSSFEISPGDRMPLHGRLKIPELPRTRDGWVTVRGNAGGLGQPVLAFRVVVRP